MKIGDQLRAARERAGISAQDLATRAGVHLNTLYRIERGQANPTLDTLEALGRELGLSFTLSTSRRAA